MIQCPIVVQGPKSYNDALAKRFERKKGDMGSSSTGVKDRGIFVSADFRNPRTDQELQVQLEMQAAFTHVHVVGNPLQFWQQLPSYVAL